MGKRSKPNSRFHDRSDNQSRKSSIEPQYSTLLVCNFDDVKRTFESRLNKERIGIGIGIIRRRRMRRRIRIRIWIYIEIDRLIDNEIDNGEEYANKTKQNKTTVGCL